MNAGKGLKSWLNLHKGEHAGAFYLLILAVFIALVPAWYGANKPGESLKLLSDSQTLAELRIRHQSILDSFYIKNKPKRVYLNKATTDDLQSMGISAENADRIHKKLQSGFRYSSLAELSVETGLDSNKLLKFVSRSSFKNNNFRRNENREIIELNSTNTAELIELPGIGSKTALRIIRFRDALGGFISVNQVLETRGTDSTALKKLLPGFKIDLSQVRKININSCSEEELAKHPYASVREAKLICAYRKQRGNISAEDLYLIKTLSPERLQKLIPYLSF